MLCFFMCFFLFFLFNFFFFFFFFNDTATTEIYTLSLHDALPISSSLIVPLATCCMISIEVNCLVMEPRRNFTSGVFGMLDRKSTRLNSSHGYISYAVFCLKKKKKHSIHIHLLMHHTMR